MSSSVQDSLQIAILRNKQKQQRITPPTSLLIDFYYPTPQFRQKGAAILGLSLALSLLVAASFCISRANMPT